MTVTRPDAGVAVREFDHHRDPAVRTDPFTAFDRFRDEPIFWTPEFDGYWVLTRYTDIRSVLRDPETFSSRHTSIPAAGWPRPLRPVELDPPEHNRYRKLLVQCVNGPAGVTITKAVDAACVRLVAELAPRGRCDFVAEFAAPMRDALFAALFDVPAQDTERCAMWGSDLLQDTDPDRRKRAVKDFMSYAGQGIAERASGAHEGTGLLDALATAEVDGRPLRPEEAVDLAFVMGMASLDTVTNSVSFSFRHLAEHPELRRRLASEPDVAARAAEELLRLHSVVAVARTATRDTEIAGTRVRAGERVLLSTALADRDPEQYPQPGVADFDRSNTAGHLAFGSGVHRCLGARIASHGLTVALRAWHAAIPDYSLATGAAIMTDGGAVCSLAALPLVWAV